MATICGRQVPDYLPAERRGSVTVTWDGKLDMTYGLLTTLSYLEGDGSEDWMAQYIADTVERALLKDVAAALKK